MLERKKKAPKEWFVNINKSISKNKNFGVFLVLGRIGVFLDFD
jgi:hypothetical protein